MSSRGSVTNTYTRASILAWANSILDTAHLSFQDVPCHEIGLLLYGIFAPPGLTQGAISAHAENASTSVPVLTSAELTTHDRTHRNTCARYLQLLQFPAADGSRAGGRASPSPHPPTGTTEGSTDRDHLRNDNDITNANDAHPADVAVAALRGKAVVSAVMQQRNAEHVLAMIHALSSEEAELLRSTTESLDTTVTPSDNASALDTEGRSNDSSSGINMRAGNTANVVLLLGPSMTASALLNGSAFVEELKLWRWVRLMADRHCRTALSIRAAISAFLQHDVPALREPSPIPTPPTPLPPSNNAVDKRARPEDTHTGPAELMQSPASVPAQTTDDEREGDIEGSTTVAADSLAEQQDSKRVRLETSRSPVPLSTTSLAPLVGSISPVHALLSPIKDADRRGHEEEASDVAKSAVTDAMAATSTEFVQQSTALHKTLRTAHDTMTRTFQAAQQQQRSAATGDADASSASSNRSSHGAATTPAELTKDDRIGVAVPRSHALPAATNGSEAQEAMWRRRMVQTVFASGTSGGVATHDGHGDASREETDGKEGSGLTAPTMCDVCPALMAHAIQCNLNAIDALEEARAKAIAACLKKDPVALLAALQNIV